MRRRVPLKTLVPKDGVIIAGAAALMAGAGYFAWLRWGAVGFAVALAFLAALLVSAILAAHRQAQAQFQRLALEARDDYRQTEALFSLFALLKIRAPLPPLRDWAISPDFAVLLVSLIQERRPTVILELGSGASTLIAAYALERQGGGRIISLDHDAAFAAATVAAIRRHGLQEIASVVHAPLREVAFDGAAWQWYDAAKIGALPAIDLLIVDGPPGSTQPLARYPALPLLAPRLSASAAVLMDDGARPDEQTIADRWIREHSDFARQGAACEKGAIIFRRGPAPPA